MHLLVMAHGNVGRQAVDFLISRYREDVALVVTTGWDDIARAAERAGLAWLEWTGNAATAEAIAAQGGSFDLGVLAWWPHLIRQPLAGLPAAGFINFHPSLLPFNRGKHYNFWALVEEAPFGVTLHAIDQGVDSGDIVAQRAIPYDWTDTGSTLHAKAQAEILALFCDTYPQLRTLAFERTPQDPAAGSFHRASELEQASRIELDRTYRGRDLLNLLRARTFPGYPGCRFEDNGVVYEARIEIKRVDK